MAKFAAGHGVAVEEHAMLFPPEQWFSAEEGLLTIRRLRETARAEKIDNLAKILADLDEFERILEVAKEQGVGWHLAVDY